MDDYDLKILDESGELEIEGAKKSIEITHKLGTKENIIQGGDFTIPTSWNSSNNLENWTENNISITKNDEGLFFDQQYDELAIGGSDLTTLTNMTRDIYIKSDRIQANKLPISSNPDVNDKYFDIDLNVKLTPKYTEPAEFSTDPNYDFEQYYTYLKDQKNQLIDNCDIGSLFSLKYVNDSGTIYWLSFDFRFVDKNDVPVAVGRNYRSTWIEQGAKIENNYLNADRVTFNQLEVSSNRNIYDAVSYSSGYDKKEFIKGFYNYQHRIYLYSDELEQQIPILDGGYFELYLNPPIIYNLTPTISGIPSEYQVTFTGIEAVYQSVGIVNAEGENEDVIYVGDNQKNVKKLDGLEVDLGDGEALYQSSLLKNDGVSPTTTWIKNGVELPILQHSADRIVKQYQSPSMIFRAAITTDSIIDMNSILYNPMTDKFFVIIGLELDDKEAVYNCELRELLEDVAENDQLLFIKNMTYTFTDDEEGYSINLEE